MYFRTPPHVANYRAQWFVQVVNGYWREIITLESLLPVTNGLGNGEHWAGQIGGQLP